MDIELCWSGKMGDYHWSIKQHLPNMFILTVSSSPITLVQEVFLSRDILFEEDLLTKDKNTLKRCMIDLIKKGHITKIT